MWSANIISYEKVNGMAQATVSFTSDTQGELPMVLKNFGDTFDKVALNEWIYARIQSLNTADASLTSLQTVPLGPFVPVKPIPAVI